MATRRRPVGAGRKTFSTGPWKRVFFTDDPFDGEPTDLQNSRNTYIPDPSSASGLYNRPGFRLYNNGDPVLTSATPFRGQCIYTHFDTNATAFNLCVMGGRMFRVDPTLTDFEDVTPVGVTIDASETTRVYMASMNGVLCVSDGIHRPWTAGPLDASPLVGTYIDFDGLGTTWSAFGAPVVFGGSGFFILNQVNGVPARLDIAWSQPNDWTTGYQQTDFDNRWTLEQTGSTPIFGLAGTNVALYYWRERSIGAISGTVGPDLATTATHDAISQNVGTQAPQSIVQFGNVIFFIDVTGRPWSFTLGSAPVPIWQQLRGLVTSAQTGYPAITAQVATGAFEPTLNLYCVGIWSPSPGARAAPVEWQVFDANTGNYMGPWSIGSTAIGVSVDCLGSWIDSNGRPTFVVLGSAVPGGAHGYAWGLNALHSIPDILTTEGDTLPTLELTTEDGKLLTTEGQPDVFGDNGDLPLIAPQTARLGYSTSLTYLFDQTTVITGSQSPVRIAVQTTTTPETVEGTPAPTRSFDGTFRLVAGTNSVGRGASVTVSPRDVSSQWRLDRIEVVAIPSLAQPDDA